VNEPVDRVIQERERLETGLRGGMVFSVVGHLVLVGAAFAAQLMLPSRPPLQVADGFAVVLPRGGGGVPQPPAAAPPQSTPPASTPPETAPPVPEAPKVVKPPKEAPRTKGLPELDSRKSNRKKTPDPQPARAGKPEKASTAPATGSATAAQTPGLEFGPPGPGVPDGADSGGDWYLAGVQQKIWILWNQQIKSGFSQPVTVVFTILADGSVTDVNVVQSSGATLLDLAAKRAVFSAAPFGPLPKDYGTNRKTIQALFKPTS
jgi:periplasmic protein TonB